VPASEQSKTAPERESMSRQSFLVLLFTPILLLAAVIALFAYTGGAGLNAQPAAPQEAIQFENTVLRPGIIELHTRNTSANDVTISQVSINDAIWPFRISPDAQIPRLGTAVVALDYHWVEGEPYTVTLFSANAIAFSTEIGAATTTSTPSWATLLSFTLIGVYVGVLPVLLGMLWLPAMRRLGRRAMLLLMAATVGLLVYLGIDTASEAIEQAGSLDGPIQGFGIAGIGLVGTVLLLDAISRRQLATGDGARRGMTLAMLIAVGIGLHNLGEGLAIGAAYRTGVAALGAFLVIGFIIQNLTEGLGIVVPLVSERPSLRALATLGLIGGGPAILGTWIGGLSSSPALSVFFLGIGSGALFQVAYQIGKNLVWRVEERRQMPITAFAGALAGMLVLYVTGLFIK
jgi:zinc transporter ZupT